MHGLINRSIQCFLRDNYGAEKWTAIARGARLGFENFEPMLFYHPSLTEKILVSAVDVLNRPREALLEDLGAYLVLNPNLESLRRLLRFGGETFYDFLQSLEDLRGRGHLAMSDLDLPEMLLMEQGNDKFCLHCRSPIAGAGHVIMGLLRAMADDYGALVMLEYQGAGPDDETILIHLAETRFAKGRSFHLTARAETI